MGAGKSNTRPADSSITDSLGQAMQALQNIEANTETTALAKPDMSQMEGLNTKPKQYYGQGRGTALSSSTRAPTTVFGKGGK